MLGENKEHPCGGPWGAYLKALCLLHVAEPMLVSGDK